MPAVSPIVWPERCAHSIAADGTGLRRLTDDPAADTSPAFSPDGARLLFATDRTGSNELFVMPAAGGAATQITRNRRVGFRSVWSPDGSRIAFDAHRDGAWESDDGLWEIWVMNADGSGRRMLTSDSVNDWGPSWSPDGRSILFLSGSDNIYDIFIMGPDGSNRRRLTRWTER